MLSPFRPLFLGGQADNDVLLADCYSTAQDVTEFILLLFLSGGIRCIQFLELQRVHQFFTKLLLISAGGPVTHGLRCYGELRRGPFVNAASALCFVLVSCGRFESLLLRVV